jgi:predicted N-acetyltransferase YhbS
MSARLWTSRPATAADAPAIADLFRVVMGTSRNETHAAWKFQHNPFAPPLIVVAEHGDRLVGQYALWPTPLEIGGESVLGAQSLDTMTHPEYQGQGMFTTLARECYALAASYGVHLLYGFPNASSYPGFVRRLNWDHTGDVSAWTRPLRASEHPQVPSYAGAIANTIIRALPLVTRGDAHGADVPSPEELAALAAGHVQKDTCRVSRSAAWLRYRVAEGSGHAYRWVTVRRGGTLIAAATWGVDILTSYKKALLADVIGDPEAFPDVIGKALADARAWGAASMSAMSNTPAVVAALRRNSFFRHANAPLIVKPLTLHEWRANIHQHGAWRISGLDLDTY